MKNRKKFETYRLNGHPSFHSASIQPLKMDELEARISQLEAKLANPSDHDDKKWVARWLELHRKELEKKRAGRSLKQRGMQGRDRTGEVAGES